MPDLKPIDSLKELVAMLEQYPDGFVVFFQFEEGGLRRAEIIQRDSTFHRLPDAVYGSIKPSSAGEVVSPIVFTGALFTKGFTLTAMTFESEEERLRFESAVIAGVRAERQSKATA